MFTARDRVNNYLEEPILPTLYNLNNSYLHFQVTNNSVGSRQLVTNLLTIRQIWKIWDFHLKSEMEAYL